VIFFHFLELQKPKSLPPSREDEEMETLANLNVEIREEEEMGTLANLNGVMQVEDIAEENVSIGPNPSTPPNHLHSRVAQATGFSYEFQS
jgi:hypothetical protein